MAKAKYTKTSRGTYETKIWDGTYNKDGSKHRKLISSRKSSADLERKVIEFKQKVSDGDAVTFSDVTFVEYANEWLSTAKAATEKNTQRMYANTIRVHMEFLSGVRLTDIRHSHFQQAINAQLDHPPTCNRIYITFRQIIKSAVRDRILPRGAFADICEDIALPKYRKPKKRPLLQHEKEAFFLVVLDPRKDCFVALLYYLGLRRGEALALMPSDFDWESNTVSIDRVIIFPGEIGEVKPYPKTDRGVRSVPMPQPLRDRIRAFVEKCPSGSLLFHNRDAEYMTRTGYNRMWEGIVKGLQEASSEEITGLTAHIFRHNYCANLCYQVPKISTKMIAKLMGDTEKMVLDVYSHIIEEKEDISGTISDALSM